MDEQIKKTIEAIEALPEGGWFTPAYVLEQTPRMSYADLKALVAYVRELEAEERKRIADDIALGHVHCPVCTNGGRCEIDRLIDKLRVGDELVKAFNDPNPNNAFFELLNRGKARGANYTANDDTFPTEILFANGRRVGIAFDGDKPYLTLSVARP